MRQFLKFFFASLLGSIFGLFIAFFLGILVLASISAGLISKAKDTSVEVKPNSILKIDLSYPIEERSSNNPFKDLDFTSFEPVVHLGLNDIIAYINKAKTDDNIKGIYLDISIVPTGLATIETIRRALLDFKTSDKFIVAYGELATQKAYYLATVADEIYINPVGYLDFRGFASELTFFKNMLERLDIQPQVVYAGKYKSATEPVRREDMSEANREQITAIITGVYQVFLENISAARGIEITVLDSLADNMAVSDIDDAVRANLIDGVAYSDQIYDNLRSKVGIEDDDKLNWVDLNKYGGRGLDKLDNENKGKIAVLFAEGSIVDGEGDENNIGSARYAKAIRKIRQDDDIKALVFRINSGGGSALASEVILREVILAQEKMPVIVSMGNVAASGGYYIACSADSILAEPNTITGSIGVFGLLPNMKGFFNNKLGITFDYVKTGKFSDFGTITRSLSPAEMHKLQIAIDSIYITFKERVAAGRNMSMQYVDSIAQGRVWTGLQAKEIGLVDAMGGLEDAIEIAKRKAGLEAFDIKEYPELKDPIEKLLDEMNLQAGSFLLRRQLGEYYSTWEQLESIKSLKGPQTKMPFELEIY